MNLSLLFRAWCYEKRGTIERSVYRIKPVERDRQWFFEKLKGKSSLFVNTPLESPEQLDLLFYDRITWVLVDNVGLLAVGVTRHSLNGLDVHMTFWDGIKRGRAGLCRQAVQWVFKEFHVSEVYTLVPLSERVLLNFAHTVGFKDHAIRPNATRSAKGQPDSLVILTMSDYTV
jgi:hypothetical protein